MKENNIKCIDWDFKLSLLCAEEKKKKSEYNLLPGTHKMPADTAIYNIFITSLFLFCNNSSKHIKNKNALILNAICNCILLSAFFIRMIFLN